MSRDTACYYGLMLCEMATNTLFAKFANTFAKKVCQVGQHNSMLCYYFARRGSLLSRPAQFDTVLCLRSESPFLADAVACCLYMRCLYRPSL